MDEKKLQKTWWDAQLIVSKRGFLTLIFGKNRAKTTRLCREIVRLDRFNKPPCIKNFNKHNTRSLSRISHVEGKGNGVDCLE